MSLQGWGFWTDDFDWDNAEYILRDSTEGIDLPTPVKGKEATIAAAGALFEYTSNSIEIVEASHKYPVAFIGPEGDLLLYDLHDDEGDRLPYRLPW